MGKFIDAGRRPNKPVGYCIYCGSQNDLSREHIIPKSLGGNWVLGAASCVSCAAITRDFEQTVARRMFGNFRSQFGMPSSTLKKKGGIRIVSLVVENEDSARVDDLPADEVPTLPLLLPKFGSPRLLLAQHPSPDFENQIDLAMWSRPEQAKQGTAFHDLIDDGAKAIGLRVQLPLADFARMLAKIAHAGMVALFGPGIIPSELAPYVLGQNNCLRHVVGGTSAGCRNLPDQVHWGFEPGIYNRGDRRFVMAKIELFRFLYLPWIKMGRGPVYWVVVCPADARLADIVTADLSRSFRPSVT